MADGNARRSKSTLLSSQDPPAFQLLNPGGGCDLVLLCDHASNRVPARLEGLGLAPGQLADHIGWDPGAADVARRLSELLDAPLVSSGYSRLVIDCNRPLENPQSIAEQSAGVIVPGNLRLTRAQRRARVEELYEPYHRAIGRLLDGRIGCRTRLLAIHSFTPVLDGVRRPWQVGVSPGHTRRFGELLARALADEASLVVGLDQPYAIEPGIDYTLPAHGDTRGLANAMIEVRQSELRKQADVEVWAQRLARAGREVAGLV